MSIKIATIDLETFWSETHSLSKMSPLVYCMHPDTELISMSVKCDNYPTDVFFGEDEIRHAVKSMRGFKDYLVLGHNMSEFDAMILAWRLGVTPKMWGCTLAMARPVHAKTTGLSLAKLVAFYADKLRATGINPVKDNTILFNTRGKRLADFSPDERTRMKVYNADDANQCKGLFHCLLPHYSAAEMWQIDASIRMLVEPVFQADKALLSQALLDEREDKRISALRLTRKLLTLGLGTETMLAATNVEELLVAAKGALHSAAQFSTLLRALNVEVPMKPSPTDPDNKIVPALAKTDPGFLELLEHDDPLVAAAAHARLDAKSTLLETRLGAFLHAAEATGGYVPIPIKYCGADTTGRWSGWAYNPQNLPRIPRDRNGDIVDKRTNALRLSLRAPPGQMVMVADLSGIEMRVNHFLWKVPSTMALFTNDPQADLYRASGAIAHGVSAEEVSKDQRQVEKTKHLGLGFGAGKVGYQRAAKTLGGLTLTLEEAQDHVDAWRAQYPEIAGRDGGWKTCHARLIDMQAGDEIPIDPWGLCHTTHEGIVLPSKRVIRYPGLRQERNADGGREWLYGSGRHETRIYAGKIVENIVQALARDILAGHALEFFKRTGWRYALTVHDELVYVVPESMAAGLLDTLQSIMRTPPRWWPELVTWSEGDFAHSYGDAK